jgi:hypothetical protein
MLTIGFNVFTSRCKENKCVVYDWAMKALNSLSDLRKKNEQERFW